ncbi:ABC transporter permease [Rhodococcus sp. ABRD24]|uniref:ABC transporter permease n=1 Tax=Rhodococcus sp. ABRD24 TaxID=2507582 RepID=UPI00103C1A5E|nr:ABC transporter permease [Rhodococcus sp. ABRD24]QBJ96706.1 ABC transporter permease [Rhodococcus sp. ABRD24]
MLAVANLRTQWTSFLAAFIATAFGVALITSTFIVFDSSRPLVQPRLSESTALALPARSFDEFGNRADYIPWSEEEARRIATDLTTVPGIDTVVTDRAFYVQPFLDDVPVADDGAREAGHGWSSVELGPFSLVDGDAPATPEQIVVPATLGVDVGGTVAVNLSAGPREFTVSGVLDGPGFYVTDELAETLQPGVRAIGVVKAVGASEDDVVRQAEEALAARGTVVSGNDRATLEPEYLWHRRHLGDQLIVAMAVLAMFTTVFVVGSTLALATSERRREIGLLRTVGASPRQIRRMVLGEAAACGLGGGIVGAAAGLALAPALRLLLLGLEVQPPDFQIRVSLWPLAIAIGFGVAAAMTGAWIPARSAAKVAPIEALLDADVERRPMTGGRWIGGLSALVAGVAATPATATAGPDARVNAAIAAAMAFIVAAAMLAPVIIGAIVKVVAVPLTSLSKSAGPMLICAELRTRTRRAAGTAAPVIAGVGFAVLLSGMVETMSAAYPAEQTRQLEGLALVTPADGAAGLNDEVVAQTGAGPVGTRAPLPTRLFVPSADGNTVVIDAVGSLDPRYTAPGEAVLDEPTAQLLNARVDQTLEVRFADGLTESITVAQVLPLDPARGPFVMPRELVRAHDITALTDSVFVPKDHTPKELSPGAAVEDAYSYALRDYEVDARLTNALAMVLIAMSVGYSGLAVANSMAMSAHRRRSDTAVLTASGGTTRQLLSSAGVETAIVVLIGATLGMLVTLLPLTGMAIGLSEITSTKVGVEVSWGMVAAVVAGSLALAVAATLAVTHRVLRTHNSCRVGVSFGAAGTRGTV